MFASIGVFLAGFATAYLLTWPALALLCILGVLFEHNGHRGWAVFVGLMSLAVGYFYFAVPITKLLMYSITYVAIGLVWSFWRYRRYVQAKVIQIKAYYSKVEDQKSQVIFLAPSRNIDTISAWVIIWPFSVVENLTGDIINVIEQLITTVFKSVYYRIYKSVVGDLID